MFPNITAVLDWIEEYIINGVVAWFFNIIKDVGLFFTENLDIFSTIFGLLS